MPECTKEEFRNSVAKPSERTIDWYDSYSPILDVTDLVKQVYPDTIKAALAIIGSNLDAIRLQGPYTSLPNPLPPEQIVYNWRIHGEEWERQRCPKNNRYYWVIYPAKFIAFKNIAIGLSKTVAIQGETITLTVKVPYMLTKGKTAKLEVIVAPDWAPATTKTQPITGTGSWTETTISVPITIQPTVNPGSHSVKVIIRTDLGG